MPVGRDRWNAFVEQVVDTCPTISVDAVEQVAGVLANLELATPNMSCWLKLHDMKPGDLDQLNALVIGWTVRTAKLALDEIASRLKLIQELARLCGSRVTPPPASASRVTERVVPPHPQIV